MKQKKKYETREKTKVEVSCLDLTTKEMFQGMYQKEELLVLSILGIKLWISCTINLETTEIKLEGNRIGICLAIGFQVIA